MNIAIKNDFYISCKGRNKDIRAAQDILHKVKSEYSAASPYLANLLAEKHLNKPLSRRNWTNHKLWAFREVQKKYKDSNIEYVKTLLEVIKSARAANCKEYSELAFIIAKSNGFKKCDCVTFERLMPDGTLEDVDHMVLLINQKIPKNISRHKVFYVESATSDSAFVPSKKAIVIDPLLGIVDYWNNAVIKYQNMCSELTSKNLYVMAKEPLLAKKSDIQFIKHKYPELSIEHIKKQNETNVLKRIIDFIFK